MKRRWKIAQFFEANWWRWYLSGKNETDYLHWKRQYWKRFLDMANGWPLPGERLLDAGAGPAGVFLMFPENEVTAVDPLLPSYRKQLVYLQNGHFPNVRFLDTALESYVPDSPFDRIYCLNAINHVADLEACLRCLRNALRPGGRLLLSVDTHNYLIFKKIFNLLPGDILHPQQLDLNEYLSKLQNVGFFPVSVKLLHRHFFFSYHLIEAN